MKKKQKNDNQTVPCFYSLRLRLVSKMAFGMSLVAAILLILALTFISHFQGTSYAEIIQSHLITQQSLGPALLLTALLLFVVVGAMTWLISLEASFKVAGPLYRFSRNLELAPIPNQSESIRKNDCLHHLSDKLVTSVDGLHQHY